MKPSTLEKYMAADPVFKGMAPEHLKVIAEHATEVSFNSGTLIFNQDGNAEHFYLILEGEVTIEIPAIYGSPIIMQTLGPGEVVGWSWLLPPFKWHFDARAAENTKAIQVDGLALREQCERDPKFGYDLLMHFSQFMMHRLSAARLRVMEMYVPDC